MTGCLQSWRLDARSWLSPSPKASEAWHDYKPEAKHPKNSEVELKSFGLSLRTQGPISLECLCTRQSLLYLFSLIWAMGKGWVILRRVYNHPGRREDIPHGKPWPPSFVYQIIETKDAKEKFPTSLTLGEEKGWNPGISQKGTWGRDFT